MGEDVDEFPDDVTRKNYAMYLDKTEAELDTLLENPEAQMNF